VLSAPQSDEEPDKPKHLLFAAVGFVAGLTATGMAILYFLVYRESIITIESLERTLNLRVLGAVPDII
jgi:capsular polysaccharide biosynthesis protein